MELPILMRSWSVFARCLPLTGRMLLRAAGAVFLVLIAYGHTTSESSADQGLEVSPTNISITQATELDHGDSKTEQKVPRVLELVLKDLASSDPETRLLALDYWDAEHIHLLLGPVFEAMEDKDAAVRARATAIIERLWAVEQKVIDLTFSTIESTGDQLVTRVP